MLFSINTLSLAGLMQCEPRVFIDAQAVAAYLEPFRAAGKRIVTTNGCFDLLHAGHVQYLYEAAACGDLLVVGLNSDEVVRRLKGEGRPVQNENDRASIMGALRMVDAAFIFPENDPIAFISVIRPHVHVKGGDYTADILERPAVEAHGGEVRIVSFKDGRSTTSIVQRIAAAGDAA